MYERIPGMKGNRGVQTPPHTRMIRRTMTMPNGCIEFMGSRDGKGYGKVSAGLGMSPLKAHRLAWELANGPIPEDAWVLHRCDNPPCVNPDHLFLGDSLTNVIDMVSKGRHHNQVKGSCPAGHSYAKHGRIVYTHGRPGRVCSICRREANRLYRLRKKAS